MASKAPTVTVTVAGEERTVVFNLGTLARIEERTGRTIIGLAQETAELVAGVGDRTEAELASLGARMKVGEMRALVAACLDVTPQQLDGMIGLGELVPLWQPLVVGLIEAAVQLSARPGEGEEGGAHPQNSAA